MRCSIYLWYFPLEKLRSAGQYIFHHMFRICYFLFTSRNLQEILSRRLVTQMPGLWVWPTCRQRPHRLAFPASSPSLPSPLCNIPSSSAIPCSKLKVVCRRIWGDASLRYGVMPPERANGLWSPRTKVHWVRLLDHLLCVWSTYSGVRNHQMESKRQSVIIDPTSNLIATVAHTK